MPIYLYAVVGSDGSLAGTFEWTQSMHEPALEQHPQSGLPVRRIPCVPNLATRYTPGQTQSRLDNRNLERSGFTKYERDRLTGKYHRVAGKGGPETLHKPPCQTC